jgi:hypothetical protein
MTSPAIPRWDGCARRSASRTPSPVVERGGLSRRCRSHGGPSRRRGGRRSLFEALVFGRARARPCGAAASWTTSEVAADVTALRRAAEEAIEIARQDRAVPVRRCARQEAGLAPEVILIEDDAALSRHGAIRAAAAGLSFRAYANGESRARGPDGFETEGRRPSCCSTSGLCRASTDISCTSACARGRRAPMPSCSSRQRRLKGDQVRALRCRRARLRRRNRSLPHAGGQDPALARPRAAIFLRPNDTAVIWVEL